MLFLCCCVGILLIQVPSNNESYQIYRAKEWAADRKRKNASSPEKTAKKITKKVSNISEDDEERDVVENLPTIAKRSTRRRGKSKVVAAALAADNTDDEVSEATPSLDESSIGSSSRSTRRTSRRSTSATATTTTAAAPKPVDRKAPVKRGGRKKAVVPPPVVEEKVVTPEVKTEVEFDFEEKKGVKEEVVVVEEENEEVIERLVMCRSTSFLCFVSHWYLLTSIYDMMYISVQEETAVEIKSVAKEQNTSVLSILFSLTPMFIQCLLIQWTFAFAVILTFFFDWWVYGTLNAIDKTEGVGPVTEVEAMMENQRESCAIYGAWLVTIVGYSVVFGARSKAGAILTGSVLTMVAFSTKLIDMSVLSLPIYSYEGFDITVPDLLAVMGMIGCIATLLQPAQKPDDKTSFIGQRVAIEKGDESFVGTVKDFNAESRQWVIQCE